VDKLVEASEMFTPADIEFAARKSAQSAFEREIEFRRGNRRAPTTTWRRSPIHARRSPLRWSLSSEFEEDIAERTRL
jgi:hypothetical protein